MKLASLHGALLLSEKPLCAYEYQSIEDLKKLGNHQSKTRNA